MFYDGNKKLQDPLVLQMHYKKLDIKMEKIK